VAGGGGASNAFVVIDIVIPLFGFEVLRMQEIARELNALGRTPTPAMSNRAKERRSANANLHIVITNTEKLSIVFSVSNERTRATHGV
jgi:hypothetical protein